MESAYAVTLTPDVIPPHVHEYVDGFCSCGEADPNATTTNQAPIITAETLELDAYADGSKTLGGIEFNFTELGTYGEGIQWRTKNGKIASLWNATATPLGIAKIEITLAEGRDGYSNTDALVIAFGNAADSLTYSTTLSTISGTAKYTITPDAGTYTFFKMTHNFDKTMYIARIAIYYTGGAVHEHNFVDGNCACGESDPNYVPSAPSHTCADTNGDYLCDEETCTNVIAPAADSTLTIVQANALGMAHAHNKYTSGQYTVVGEILSVDNVSYGNITIKDADGNILVIYGSKAADGTDYSALAVKYIVGDIVSVYGIIGKYSDAAQMKNGLVTVVEQHDHVYDAGECACGAADPDFVPTHTCADEDGDYVCDEADCDKYLLPAPDVLSRITVDYYGSPTQINGVAAVSVSDARTLTIQPWDPSTLKDIERAILASDLGITPLNDGKVIRLVFPQLTEERRREMTKQIAKLGEGAKVAVRNIRRDANDKVKAMKKDGEMTEDEVKSSDKIVQDLTDKYIREIDKVTELKNKEIMEI